MCLALAAVSHSRPQMPDAHVLMRSGMHNLRRSARDFLRTSFLRCYRLNIAAVDLTCSALGFDKLASSSVKRSMLKSSFSASLARSYYGRFNASSWIALKSMVLPSVSKLCRFDLAGFRVTLAISLYPFYFVVVISQKEPRCLWLRLWLER